MGDDSRIASILGQWQEQLDRGEDVDPERVIAEHPDLADALRERFEALSQAHAARAAKPSPTRLRTLPVDRYGEFRPAGEGGMGIVYWAIDTDLNREVAFKIIRSGAQEAGTPTPKRPTELTPPGQDTPASKSFETLKQRFLQEAWITSGMTHPGIVPVYELGQTPEGIPYYTMRFIKGERTLATALEESREQDIESRLALLEPFLKVCDTLRYAHSRGVIHRDLKPENIAIGEFGEVVLLDWGLAKLQDSPDLEQDRLQAHVQAYRDATDLKTVAGALGTPGYMAPEAARGQADRMDARSDLYSLGAIFYQILTGRLPYAFETFGQLVEKILHEDVRPASEVAAGVPESLSELCARCLAREPTARPESADALARWIRDWQAQSAADREIDRLMREARSSLTTAENLHGNLLLRHADAAAATCTEILKKRPDHAGAHELQKEVRALRRRGIQEKERAERKRVLSRVALAALVVVILAAGAVVVVLQERQRETEVALRQQAAERKRADDETEATRARLADAYSGHARALRLAGRGAAARLAAIRALENAPTPERWRALIQADATWTPRARWIGPALRKARAEPGDGVFAPDGSCVHLFVLGSGMLRWTPDDAGTELIHTSQWGPRRRALTSYGVVRFLVSADETVHYRLGFDAEPSARDSRSYIAAVDLETEVEARRLEVPSGGLMSLEISPDGRRLYGGGRDDVVHVWDTRTESIVDSFPGGAYDLVVSDDGRRLAARTRDDVLLILDPETGYRVSTLDTSELDLNHPVVLSPDGSLALVWEGQARTDLRLYDATTGRLRAVLIAEMDCLPWPGTAIFLDGGRRLRSVVTTPRGHAVRECDLSAPPASEVLDRSANARCVAASPDGSRIAASVTAPNSLRVWDPRTHRVVTELPVAVHTMAFSPDGTRLYVDGPDAGVEPATRSIAVWDLDSGSRIAMYPAHEGGVATLVLSSDGRRLYSVGRADGCVKAWDTGSPASPEVLLEGLAAAENEPGPHLALSPDDERLYLVDGEGRIRMGHLGEAMRWQEFEQSAGRPYDLALSPDGSRLAVRDPEGGLLVMDGISGAVLRRCQPGRPVPGESDTVRVYPATTALTFTADGRHVVSGHQTVGDGVFLRIWDTTTGDVVADLPLLNPRHSESWSVSLTGVNSLAVTPDGRVLYAAGMEGVSAWNLHLLLVEPDEMMRRCEEAYGERLEDFDARLIMPVVQEEDE